MLDFVFLYCITRVRACLKYKERVRVQAFLHFLKKDFEHIVSCVEQNSQHIVLLRRKSKITDKNRNLYK